MASRRWRRVDVASRVDMASRRWRRVSTRGTSGRWDRDAAARHSQTSARSIILATDLSRARRCATMRARASTTAASRARRAPDSRSRARRAAPPSARIALRRRSARRCAGVACSSDARRPVEPRRPTLLRQLAARRGGAPSSSLDELSDESGEPAGGGGGGARIWAASSASMRASAASAAATSAAVGLLGDAVGSGAAGAGAGGAAFFVGVSSSSSLRTASAFSFDARGRRCGEREREAIGRLRAARRVCERLRFTGLSWPAGGRNGPRWCARSEMVLQCFTRAGTLRRWPVIWSVLFATTSNF